MSLWSTSRRRIICSTCPSGPVAVSLAVLLLVIHDGAEQLRPRRQKKRTFPAPTTVRTMRLAFLLENRWTDALPLPLESRIISPSCYEPSTFTRGSVGTYDQVKSARVQRCEFQAWVWTAVARHCTAFIVLTSPSKMDATVTCDIMLTSARMSGRMFANLASWLWRPENSPNKSTLLKWRSHQIYYGWCRWQNLRLLSTCDPEKFKGQELALLGREADDSYVRGSNQSSCTDEHNFIHVYSGEGRPRLFTEK